MEKVNTPHPRVAQAGRRQRHPRVVVVSTDEAIPTTGTHPRGGDSGAAHDAMDAHLSTAKHMLQCVFPVPEANTPDAETPRFDLLVASHRAPFDGYSPEKTLRSVRTLVECFSPTNLDVVDSGRRALSDMLMHHLRTYADCVTTALARELDAAATSSTVSANEEADATALDVSSSPPLTGAAAEEEETSDHGSRTAVARLAFTRLVTAWSHFRTAAVEVANLWVYLGTQSTVTCSVRYLEAALEAHPTIVDHALAGFSAVLTTILHAGGDEADASAHAAEKKALHDVTELFLAINQYAMRVQPVAVKAVRMFYQAEAARRWSEDITVTDYYRWIERSWAVERARCQDYLHPETAPLLEAAIDECVLDTDITREIVSRDIGELIESHMYDSQQLLLRVASRSSVVEAASVSTLTRAFRAYIEHTGRSYMCYLGGDADKAQPASLTSQTTHAALASPYGVVCALIALLERCEDTVKYGFFKAQKEFSAPLHEGIQTVLSTYTQPFSDQLAQYLDYVMKEIEDGVYPLTATAAPSKKTGADVTDAASDTPQASALSERRSRSRSPPLSPPPSHTHDASHDRKRTAVEVGTRPAAATKTRRPQLGETVLASISRLFSYHPNKDYFEAFYWRGLSCRLLHPYRTPHLEAEEYFIRLLKVICGGSVTSKFEGMLLDVRAAHDTDALYVEWVKSGGTSITKPKPMNANRNTDASGEAGTSPAPVLTGPLVPPPPSLRLHCRFFTQGFWPTSPFTVRLPPVLARQAAQLEGFYQASFNNRRLQWRHGLATAELRARYMTRTDTPRTYQLFGTFAQSLILMYLDAHQPRHAVTNASSSAAVAAAPTGRDKTGISINALCEALEMDRTHFETRDALHGLCHPRCPLLVRTAGDGATDSAASTVAPSDVLVINDDFTSPTIKVRIPCFARPRVGARRAAGAASGVGGGAAPDHADEEADKVASKVVAERDFMIEVALSRYMKAHRTCSHAELIEEAPKMLRFSVTPAAMKKCIERLITRNFLTRNDAGGYEFVV